MSSYKCACGNAFGCICLCVCTVPVLTVESLDLESSFLVRCCVFRISRSSSRSQEQRRKNGIEEFN